MQAWISEVANTFSGINGFTSLAYAILTVGFFTAGLSYLVAPVPMLRAVFGGSVGGAGPESIVLWQLIGIGLSTIVAPACLSLKVGAESFWSDCRSHLGTSSSVAYGKPVYSVNCSASVQKVDDM